MCYRSLHGFVIGETKMNSNDNKWFILVCIVLAIVLALGVGGFLFLIFMPVITFYLM